MTGLAVLLVLVSALAHASWNFLAKRGDSPEIFTWSMAAASNTLLAPLAVVLLWLYPPDAIGWVFVAATWLLHVGYFVALSRAYRYSDLSIAYPVARGLGLLLIPVLGVVALRESMSPPAMAGAALIVSGIFTLGWWGRFHSIMRRPFALLREKGVRYALLTGAIIGGYSVLDKQGVQHVTPFLYMYFVAAGGSLGMLPFLRGEYSREAFAAEWRAHRVSIVAGGLLQFAAYGLVLTALQVSQVSYVGPFREVGIVFGVLLGTLVLREPFAGGRLLGSAMIVAGAASIALSP